MEWIYLILSIICEVVATTFLRCSNGFQKILPTIGMLLGYIMCLAFLAAIKKIDISVVYAIWGAVGIIAMTIIGVLFFKESISVLKVFSILFIVLGVIGLNLSGVNH